MSSMPNSKMSRITTATPPEWLDFRLDDEKNLPEQNTALLGQGFELFLIHQSDQHVVENAATLEKRDLLIGIEATEYADLLLPPI